MSEELEYRYDTQLLIEGEDLDEDEINDYFVENFKGDCLLAVGDEELIKIHYHTNEPWKVLEYCSTLGEIYDIVIEDMDRQSLIERLQKAFDGDERQRNTSDISDVEYKGDTNTLYVKEQKLFNMQNDEPDTLHVMSEEEIFERLYKERQ